jgi:hypothetical protein
MPAHLNPITPHHHFLFRRHLQPAPPQIITQRIPINGLQKPCSRLQATPVIT